MPDFPLRGVPAPDEVQLWRLDSANIYLVYFVPGTDIPMAWHIEDPATLTTILGNQTLTTYDRELTKDQFFAAGGLMFGESRELINLSDHPFDGFMSQLSTERQIQPWLEDPEVLAVTFSAILEGRTPTPAELMATDWFKGHSEAERSWLLINASDPATAKQLITDNRTRIRDLFISAGAHNPPSLAINKIADLFTQGQLTETQLNETVRSLTDPYSNARLPSPVRDLFDGNLPTFDQTRQYEEEVRQIALQYLGPVHGVWNADRIATWAGRLRNDPDAETQLRTTLRNQLRALYPMYEDPTMTWEDISGPWLSLIENQWQTTFDPTDPLLDKLIRMNDGDEARKLLRSEGVNRGIEAVTNSALNDMMQSFGGTVVRSV